MFGCVVELPSWECNTCTDLARLVKAFLGREVSDLPMVQMSFQSIKKGLPSSCKCMESGMIDELARSIGSPPPPLPRGYLDFVRKQVRVLFRKGWDASYESKCIVATPPLSSCSEASRSLGGSLSQWEGRQSDYLDFVLHGKGEAMGGLSGELMVVQSAGKPRPLSKFESEMLYLDPLHKTIYSHLKKMRWLLTGDPSREKLSRAGFRQEGGELTSGDYKSATDGLYIEVAEVILETLFESSVFIPRIVKESMLAALRPMLFWCDGRKSVEVCRGQMMGSKGSFPLLCLQNKIAFEWSLKKAGIREPVPHLINGDDILFQRDGHFQKWSEVLPDVGLAVEHTKTSVEKDWGTINSTLLVWRDGLLEPSWSARFGMFRPAEHPGNLGKSFLSFLHGCTDPGLRFRAGREFFKWHLSELRSSGVSLPSLGFRGLLARRLSRLFSLLELPDAEFPRAFDKHAVGYDAEFISRSDLASLGPEELLHSSLELGSQKWSGGYKKVDVVREAIRYCLRRSAVKGNRFDYPAIPSFVFAGPREFSFGSKNLSPRRPPKPTSVKSFLAPFPPRSEVLVSSDVLWSLGAWWEDGTLPAYSELPPEDHFFR